LKKRLHVVYCLHVTYVWPIKSRHLDTAIQMYNTKVHSYNIARDSIKLLSKKCHAFGMMRDKGCNTYLKSSWTIGR
jgi:hypothetical protein